MRALAVDRRLAGRGLLAGVAAIVGCSSPPTAVEPPIEVVIASGDEQYGTVGQQLPRPLRVLVHTASGRIPQEGITVSWEIQQGDAAFVGASASVTDSTGSAEVALRLGTATGTVTVSATALGRNNPQTLFRAFTVERPTLDGLVPTSASPGDDITVLGDNFSSRPEDNVVLFSGVRGWVTAATATELSVEVPRCLPARGVDVRVQRGTVASDALPLTVGPGGEILDLAVGGYVDVADDGGYTCLGLSGGGAQYLSIPFSASTVGAARHPFELFGVSSTAPPPAGTPVAPLAEPAAPRPEGGSDLQGAWDRRLREIEARAAEERPRSGALGLEGLLPSGPARTPPSVGDRRSFFVYRSTGSFAQVAAVARLVSERAALFVDENAPAGGLTDADLQAFADRFDDAIHPTVADNFGSESDLDGNQRVIILFTPEVNALTPRGSGGFIGGFFFGIDLLDDREGSNGGEVFYTLVPDPTGVFSDARSKDQVLSVAPAVLAHEFQHMVHFNERMLVRSAESTEAVWLSEGLAQQAEELVARAYETRGDPASAELFRSGVKARARRYLTGTDTVSLIFSTGQGSLTERGATFLYVAYLEDRLGPEVLLGLTRTTRTGVSNVEVETGQAWPEGLADWWSAVYLDDPLPESGPLGYPDVDLRGFLGNPFPLEPVQLGGGDFVRGGSVWSSSAGYYIVAPPAGGSTALRLGGADGGPSSPEAALRMRVIRIS